MQLLDIALITETSSSKSHDFTDIVQNENNNLDIFQVQRLLYLSVTLLVLIKLGLVVRHVWVTGDSKMILQMKQALMMVLE